MSEPFRLLARGAQLALLQNDALIEFYQEEADAQSLVGSVLLGRVERVLPGVKAAFVRIGLSQNGFLPLREADSFHLANGDAPLMTGQDILVQVKKDPKGDKGAFLTRDVALAGQYALVMPQNRFIGLSRRVTGEADRARAKALGRRMAGGRFGLIVRHAALCAPLDEVQAEIEALWQSWQDIQSRAPYIKAPAMLYAVPSMREVVLRDYAARHPIEALGCGEAPASLPDGVCWRACTHEDMDAQWAAARIDAQVSEALDRRVALSGGGTLVIDEREALTTIDVNSGSAVLAEQDLALEENLRAVPEIARQIRLRNLSGILLVDFIDMRADEDRAKVQAAMEQAVSDDRVKTVVHGFTRLGLLEMTRKRTRDTLAGALTDPCAACRASGRVRSK